MKGKMKKLNNLFEKLGVIITSAIGSMYCAILFAILAFFGFPLHGTPFQYVQWLSTTFLQLVLLSVIMVGQRVQGNASERRMTKMLNHVTKDNDRILKEVSEILKDVTK